MCKELSAAEPTFFRSVVRSIFPWVFSTVAIVSTVLVLYRVPTLLSTPEGMVKIFGMLDQWIYFVPMSLYMDTVVQSNEIPLWNPLTYCGVPFLANPQSWVFYPPNLVRSLLTFDPTPLNTHIGLEILMAFQIFVAGISTFFLARDHKLGYGASTASTFVYIFGASFVRRVMAMHMINVVAWFPLIIFLLRRAFMAATFRARMLYGLACGTAFGMSALAGFPQVLLYISFSVIGYGVVFRLLHIRRCDFRLRGGLPGLIVQDAAVGVTVFVVGGLLGAAMLFPAFELTSFTERSHSADIFVDAQYSFERLFNLFTSYIGSGDQWCNFRLAGLGASLLALAAISYERKRDIVLFGAMFLILLDCCLGPPLPFSKLLVWIAPFVLKDSTRAMLVLGLPLAMLVGFGVEAVARRWHERASSPMHTAFFVVFGVFAFQELISAVKAVSIFDTSAWNFIFPAAILAIIALAGGPFSSAASRRTGEVTTRFLPRRLCKPYGIVSLLLPLLLLGELFVWGQPYAGYLRGWLGYSLPLAPLSMEYPFWDDNYRGADKYPNRSLLAMKPSINGYDPLYLERVHRVLNSPPNMKYDLRPTDVLAENHRGNLFLKRSFWLARQYVEGPLPDVESVFPSATTVFLEEVPDGFPLPEVSLEQVVGRSVSSTSTRSSLADESMIGRWVTRSSSNSDELSLDIPAFDTLPLHGVLKIQYQSSHGATIKTSFHEISSETSTLGKTYRVGATRGKDGVMAIPMPDYKKLRAALKVELSTPGASFRFSRAYVDYDSSDEDGHINIVERKPNSVEVILSDLPGPRVLTFVDAYYPGWKAYVDEEEVPILLANDAFKAIVVPEGTHRVRFSFSSTPALLGIIVSGMTVLSVVLVFLWAVYAAYRGTCDGVEHTQ